MKGYGEYKQNIELISDIQIVYTCTLVQCIGTLMDQHFVYLKSYEKGNCAGHTSLTYFRKGVVVSL